jgi:hypothetical protein
MRILCTGPGIYSGDELIIGKYYEAVEVDTPTERQNRAFHALIQEFYASGCHSYNVKSFKQFRNYIKRDIGAGFERYKYVEQTSSGLKWGGCKTPDGIPENVARDECGNPLASGILKSWSDYSKKERTETIDRLINIMIQCDVNNKKFYEIIDGMRSDAYKDTL